MNESTKTIVAVTTVTVAAIYAVGGLIKAGKHVVREHKIKKAANNES